jgi:hypothetical protein
MTTFNDEQDAEDFAALVRMIETARGIHAGHANDETMKSNERNNRVELYEDVLGDMGQMVAAMNAMFVAFDQLNESLRKMWEDDKRNEAS